MQHALDATLEWSQLNHMNINCKKTKEMVLGSLSNESLIPLTAVSWCHFRSDRVMQGTPDIHCCQAKEL